MRVDDVAPASRGRGPTTPRVRNDRAVSRQMKTTAATLRVYERKRGDVLRVDDVAPFRGVAVLRRRAWNDRAVSPTNEDHGRDATGLRAEAPRV